MTAYSFAGQVVEAGTRQGLPGLRVEAWDASHACTDLVCAAFTDKAGLFTLTLDDGVVQDLFLSRVATLYFKVFREGRAIADTSSSLLWRVPTGDAGGRIEIQHGDHAISKHEPAPFTVRGQVLSTSTGPMPGVTVKAAHKTLRSEIALGGALADAAGRYQIRYSSAPLEASGKARADLVLHVFDASGHALADSPVVFQAPVTATIDVTVGPSAYAGPAESDTILAVLTRTAGDVATSALSQSDQAFLVSAEGLDATALATLVAAAQLGQETAPSGTELSASALALYAAGRGGIPLTTAGLFRVPPARLQAAITASVAANIIPVTTGSTPGGLAALVQQVAIAAALVPSHDGLVATTGDVLGTVASDAPTQQVFLQLYLERTSTSQFWVGLAANASFSQPGRVAAFQLAFDVADTSQQHLPLIKAIVVGQVAGTTVTQLRDLARLDASDWSAILNQSYGGTVIGAPASIPGATLADKIGNYAATLTTTLATRFPTPAIAGRLAKLNRPVDADLVTFFAQNPDFEFSSTRVAAYVAANPQATAGLSQPATAVQALKARERVFKLTRTFEQSDPLILAGIDSARAVESLGQTALYAQFGGTLGAAAVQSIVNNACFITAAVGVLAARHSAQFNPVLMRGLPTLALTQPPVLRRPSGANPPAGSSAPPVYLPPPMADWQALFGTVDLCVCDECASVYGPAAYLVDVLDFLNSLPSTVTYTSGTQTLFYSARDLLIGQGASTKGFSLVGRRPDIGHLLLNCDNADTPVPYIDLLNEVLEYKVVAITGQPFTFADGAATTGEAADLSTTRQVLPAELPAYTTAYATLATTSYPWSLPFDRAAQEAMAHLAALGVPAPTLMQTFPPPALVKPPAPPANPAATEAAAEIAAVTLGLLPRDRSILVGRPLGGGPASPGTDWGLTTTTGWETQLLVVGTFLEATALLYADLLELLDASLFTPFLAAGVAGPTVTLITPMPGGSDCDPMNLLVTGLDATKLAQLWPLVHRFLRLRGKLGVTTTELDKAIAQFTPTGQIALIDDAMLERLSVMMTIRAQVGTSILEMLSWWGPVDRRPSALSNQLSLFGQTFLNPALSNAVDDESVFVALANPALTSSSPLAGTPSPALADHAARVAAASQLVGSDYALLTDTVTSPVALGLTSELAATALLTLDAVSHVFRFASLARALKLSVGDLLQLRALSGIDPFSAADLTQTTSFIATVQQVQGSGFTVPLLAYLVRQLAPVTTPYALLPARAASFLVDLAPLLTKIVADTTFAATSLPGGDLTTDDPTGALTTKALGTILPHQQPAGVLGPDVVSALQALQAPTTASVLTAFSFLGTTLATQLATDVVAATSIEQRYGYAGPQLLLYLRRTQSITLVERKLAAALKLDTSIVSGLLETWLLSSRTGPTTLAAIEDFLPAATPDGGGPDLTLWATTTYLRLQKVAALVLTLRFTAVELPMLLPPPVGQGFIDLNALPATPGVVAPVSTALFGSWQRLVNACAVRARLLGGPTALFTLIAQAVAAPSPAPPALPPPPPASFLANLSQATGWSNADLTALTTFYGLTLADFQKETGYVTLANAFDVLTRLGASAASAMVWASSFFVAIDSTFSNYSTAAYDPGTATAIKMAAKGKFDDADWLTAEKPVSDELRDAQRAALVAYMLGNTTYVPSPGASPVKRYITDNDLYDDLLVDVGTSPSVVTSRLKLAMGSAQLFVQRCLLGLEQVTLQTADAENWSWMKRYRVWEANRQIFLYPENWIVPELRDNKTELFSTFENALSKQAVTAETVADAFNTYLEGFLDLSNIEIVGTCYQPNANAYGDDILHVIGRTRGTPQDFYYRQRIGLQYWTGWEKITASIDGTVVLPVVFEHRFFLFWPMVTIANDPTVGGGTVPVSGDPVAAASQHVEIQVAWTERKHAQWTGKKLALGTITAETELWTDQLLNIFNFDPDDAISRSLLFDTLADESAGTIRVRAAAVNPFNGQFIYVGEADWNVCGETATCQTIPSPAGVYNPAFPAGTGPSDNQPLWILAVEEAAGSGNTLAVDPSAMTNGVPSAVQVGAPPDATDDILKSVPTPYSLVFSRQTNQFSSAYPFFLKDSTATLFIEETKVSNLTGLPTAGRLFDWPTLGYRFDPHYQPYVCTFIQTLNQYGFTGAQRWSNQVVTLQSQSMPLFTGTNPPYSPANNVVQPYPVADVDFRFSGAYSVYNWETFFHIPLMIATRLSQNQQFEDAHNWFLTIFDPTAPGSAPAPGRYWKVRPFWENTDLSSLAQQIAGLSPTLPTAQLVSALLNQEDQPATWDFQSQVEAWRREPFNPDLIARTRPIAYQKMVVMRFLDNLIAWGDSLFGQDTIESINEATQLYILAAEVLGPRPTMVQAPDTPAPTTYWGLAQAGLDAFGDALIETEGLVPTPPEKLIACPYGPSTPDIKGALYFCVPANPQLLAYWDTVADRLFKIRHSMNLQGIVQQLPLFEPPIDPALLVAAAAAGVDIDQVLDNVNGPLPVYRFVALLPKALEVAAGVSQLGMSLLAALEKSDAEGLATLRSGQELSLLQLVRAVKQRQVDEAQANVDALTQAQALVVAKQTYYHSRVVVSPGETMALALSAEATVVQATSQAIVMAGGSAQAVPTFNTGAVVPFPVELVAEGGDNIGGAIKTAGEALGVAATILHEAASVTATLAGYQRRMDDWQFQGGLADIELQQVKQQLLGAQIRLDIATKELANHDQQIANAQAVDDYLHGKFSNQALYDWMSGQIAATYFQSYQRAVDVAKRAERGYQLELALPGATFINAGNWDNLRQGLLAGEKLLYDLRRMELSYLDENVRELEITKHVSLAQSFPEALFALVTTGTTTVSLPESLFDLDYPGHYLRRLKTVSLTLPNVSGPYTSVNCTLTQQTSSILKNTVAPPYQVAGSPPSIPASSLLQVASPTVQIVTSGGVNDAGLFELNFHDERYLPFEGTGAISTFKIDLPLTSNPFDVGRLEDLVLHLKYTSRDGGNVFRGVVTSSLQPPPSGTLLVRVAADRATAWYEFRNAVAGTSPTLALDLAQDVFPYLPGGGNVTMTSLQAVAQGTAFQASSPSTSASTLPFTVAPPGGVGTPFVVSAPTWAPFGGATPPALPLGIWTFTLPAGTDLSGLSELWILLSYTMGH